MFGLLKVDEKQQKDSQCLFEKIYTEKIFSSITYFFINHMISKNEKMSSSAKVALGYVFEISLQGFLFLSVKKDIISPRPSAFFNQKQFSIEPEFLKEIEEAIIKGIHQIPQGFIHIIQNQIDVVPTKPFCKKDHKYYLQRNWIYESQCYRLLHEKKAIIPTELDNKIISQEIHKYCDTNKVSRLQAMAIQRSLENSFSLICGGPGCGKTYSILYLIKIFLSAWMKARKPIVILAAPTGKATQKLEESINGLFDLEKVSIETMTLHSLLKIRRDESKYIERKQIDADLIIIDEASMIDIRLMALLLKGAPEYSRLILLGDPDQLPPIETEGIFSTVAKKHFDLAVVNFLTEAFRFENNNLLLLAKSVKEQNIAKVISILKGSGPNIEFISMKERSNKDILEEILKKAAHQYSFSLDQQKDVDHILSNMFSFRILSCLKKGPFGSDDINERCKKYFLEKVLLGDSLILPIIVTQNDYQLNLFNGTLGIVIKQMKNRPLKETSQVKGYFLNRKNYPIFMLPHYEYSYCLTVHKSQGSEFDHVMLVIPPASDVFSKEMLYTAITRAKKKLTIVANQETIEALIKKASI